jgi:hypothetical protein
MIDFPANLSAEAVLGVELRVMPDDADDAVPRGLAARAMIHIGQVRR